MSKESITIHSPSQTRLQFAGSALTGTTKAYGMDNISPVSPKVKSKTKTPTNLTGSDESSTGSVSPASTALGFSRDEMNLAEFPLTVLSTRSDPQIKTLEFSDHLRSKNGEIIERKWIITGADKFGLPTSTDDDVVLGLIRLTMDQGFRDRKVYFTRYELLKTLRWTTEGRSYSRLIKSLDRLSGVRIRATNSFYDNSSKSYQTCNFGVIDAYEINDHRNSSRIAENSEPIKSFFIWSEMLFDSFHAGFIKKLDLDLYFSLKSAVSRRLYRYLDKHFYFKSSIEKPLMALAFEKLGLSRKYKYVSSVRQQIEPAANELLEIGFLSSFEFLGKGEQTVVRFNAKPQTQVITPSIRKKAEVDAVPAEPAEVETKPIYRNTAQNSDISHRASGTQHKLITALVERGISKAQAIRLIESKTVADYALIQRIIRYYDYLVAKNDVKVSKNKQGFLYRAVENPERFNIPQGVDLKINSATGQSVTTQGHLFASSRPELKVFKSTVDIGFERRSGAGEGVKPARVVRQSTLPSESRTFSEYKDFAEVELTKGLSGVSAEEIEKIYSNVEQKMNCLKAVLSEERFQEALNGCVREEMLKFIGVPDFKTWSASRGSC